jgi:hypothetical protein
LPESAAIPVVDDSDGLAICAALSGPAEAASGPLAGGGASTSTMLPQPGQIRICPIAEASRTFNRFWQVVQEIVNGSTRAVPPGIVRQLDERAVFIVDRPDELHTIPSTHLTKKKFGCIFVGS